ncbi:MAG: sigma-70 family RNA polymerase sigma factor [Parabacteroides sp.]|nr:sigma-70 family RNA polymerase sigma factor [Parabacteroides sp.]
MKKFNRKDALEKLFLKYKGPLYLYALKITGEPATSEDIVQEVFCKMIKYIDSINYEDEREIKAYLFAVARSCTMDIFRKNKESGYVTNSMCENVTYIGDCSNGDFDIDKAIGETTFNGNIGELIASLKEEDQHILYLRYGKVMSDEQIADLLKLNTTDAVRKRLSRARIRLGDLFKSKERK